MSKAAEDRRRQKQREREYEKVLREQFKTVQQQAIAAGVYAMSKAILDKANEEGIDDATRLDNIRNFCKVILKDEKKETEEKQSEV